MLMAQIGNGEPVAAKSFYDGRSIGDIAAEVRGRYNGSGGGGLASGDYVVIELATGYKERIVAELFR